MKLSARNQYQGNVTHIKEGAAMAEVTVKVGNLEFVAAITEGLSRAWVSSRAIRLPWPSRRPKLWSASNTSRTCGERRRAARTVRRRHRFDLSQSQEIVNGRSA